METQPNAYLDLLKSCLLASIYQESGWQIVKPKNKLKQWLLALLARKSYVLVKRRNFDKAIREVGKDWPMFGYTMIGLKRLDRKSVV